MTESFEHHEHTIVKPKSQHQRFQQQMERAFVGHFPSQIGHVFRKCTTEVVSMVRVYQPEEQMSILSVPHR